MADARLDRERKIVIEAKRLGKDDNFIKLLIERDRANSGAVAPTAASAAKPAKAPIQVEAYKPSGTFEKVYGWLERSAPGRLGTALRGAVTGDGLTKQEQIQGVGAGVETGANILSLGAGPGGGVLKNVVTNALLGATGSAGRAVSEGKTSGDVANDALKGAGVNAATTGVMTGLSATAKGLLNKGSKIAANQVVKTPTKETIRGRSNLAEGLLERGQLSTPKQTLTNIVRDTKTKIGQQSGILEDAAEQPLSLEDAVMALNKLKEGKFSSTSQRAVQGVIDDLVKQTAGRGTITIAEAQALKQMLDKEVGSSGFLADELSSAARDSKRTLANTIRRGIENTIPEIGPVNRDLAFNRRAFDQITKQEAQKTGPQFGQNLIQTLRGILLNDYVLGPTAQAAYNTSKLRLDPQTAALIQRLTGQALSR